MHDQEIDLLFVDVEDEPVSGTAVFINQAKEIRPNLPIILFSAQTDNKMRQLMRGGADWHFVKDSAEMGQLARNLQEQVLVPVDWYELFSQYDAESVRPRIEPSLSHDDLTSLNRNPEERYIIKRLFARSESVQIFRMDEGFSGSRIYTVKPNNQPKRIVKIGPIDQLQAVKQKQIELVEPRLNQAVGQIQGEIVAGRHLAGASFILGGSNQDAMTLTRFLQDDNRVRRDLIDKIMARLRDSLGQLYAGGGDMEMRYWAPLYAQVLPPNLTLADARLALPDDRNSQFVLSAEQLSTLSLVPGNPTLLAVNTAVRQGQRPELILRGFVAAEVDAKEGVVYLHDELMTRYPAWPILEGAGHPVLRFKVQLHPEERPLLQNPVFRRGKRIYVRGTVVTTRENLLAQNIQAITGQSLDLDREIFEMVSGKFISPVANINFLLWEIGREDMIAPMPLISPVIHGDLNTSNILVGLDDDLPVWLIDFSDARPGHIYFDLAKLEVEVRTHVFFRVFRQMVADGVWSVQDAFRFALLMESMLLQAHQLTFKAFLKQLGQSQPEWYDALSTQFPYYSENLLYFLYSIRRLAATYSPDRFENHYATAVFFHSMAALKYRELDNQPWQPWAKRLALCAALIAGKHAVATVTRPYLVGKVLESLRQRSAFALIAIGEGNQRKYLLQWNANWGMFNLIGGKMDDKKGDRNSFARTIQRELSEELEIFNARDYRIIHEFPPLITRQFSQRQMVFKEYEFRVYEIEFLPRHPMTREEFDWLAQRLSPERENVLVTRAEIKRLRTMTNRPISETTRMILQELGEIDRFQEKELYATLGIKVDSRKLVVQHGRAQLTGRLINPPFGAPVENIVLEILPGDGFTPEVEAAGVRVEKLAVGEAYPLSIWLRPEAEQATIVIRATYYDQRGHRYQQNLEGVFMFLPEVGSPAQMESPYVVGRPLTTEHEALFVGRDDVFYWLETHLLGKAQPHSLIVYGQRHMGKTSALQQFVYGRRGQAVRNYEEYPIYLVYINLQGAAQMDTQTLFDQIRRQIGQTLHQRGIVMPLAPPSGPQGTIYSDFDDFLDQVEITLPSLSLLVLVLDEMEQLRHGVENGRLSSGIFTYFRSLIQHRPRLTFVMAGTNQLVEDYWGQIFHAGVGHELLPLSQEETAELVCRPVAAMIQYEETAVAAIWQATRGHPYFVQLLCHKLVLQANGRHRLLTVADVQKVVAHIISEDDSQLQNLWNDSTREERFVLAALSTGAEDGRLTTSRTVISQRLQQTPFAEEAISMAVKQLELRRLIARQFVQQPMAAELVQTAVWQHSPAQPNDVYAIAFALLRRWVARKHPLTGML